MNQRATIRNDILISIQPEYADQIMDGCKTVELRRRFAEGVGQDARLFIYSSNPVGAIIGCAKIDKVVRLPIKQIWRKFHKQACIEKGEFEKYFDGVEFGFVVSLGDVTPLTELLVREDILDRWGIRPPQSYMYLPADIAASISSGIDEIPSRHKYRPRNRR
jgi:predicted transcriptional regulator